MLWPSTMVQSWTMPHGKPWYSIKSAVPVESLWSCSAITEDLCPDVSFSLDRLRLFRSMNQHPTLYEIVTGKHRPGGKEGNKRKRVDMVRLPLRCPQTMLNTPWSHGSVISHCTLMSTFPSCRGQCVLQDPGVAPAKAADAPLPTGRLLDYHDITPTLKGRQAEVSALGLLDTNFSSPAAILRGVALHHLLEEEAGLLASF